MDFSAFNPNSSNSLNLAARMNDVVRMKYLITSGTNNPNCVDNRGWTALHEAAAHNGLEATLYLLSLPDTRVLSETFEGHTCLYLAIREKCSMNIIQIILDNIEDIANYASNEMVSPLHLACQQGREELVEALIKSHALLDIRDFDGDTPLHDAAVKGRWQAVGVLLHAGADPEVSNLAGLTPLHLACMKGCSRTVQALLPFITHVDLTDNNGNTSLIVATAQGNLAVVEYLLLCGADPNQSNFDEEVALRVALINGHANLFQLLFSLTNVEKMGHDIVLVACKPHYFNMDIILTLLQSNLGPEFFNVSDPFYVTLEGVMNANPTYTLNSPLGSFLQIADYIHTMSPELFEKLLYLFLMRGVPIDASIPEECPPLVYIHYCEHGHCLNDLVYILLKQGCNIDYKNELLLPDILVASVTTGAQTLPMFLQYSLLCEPDSMLQEMDTTDFLCQRIAPKIIQDIIAMCGYMPSLLNLSKDQVPTVPPLKHLCRLAIRQRLRNIKIKTTNDFFKALSKLPLPTVLKRYLRYA